MTYAYPVPQRFGLLPFAQGVKFICDNCGRAYAVPRDDALRAWGEQGIVADVARRLRCKNCRRRGMTAEIAPGRIGFGSKPALDRFVDEIMTLKPDGEVR